MPSKKALSESQKKAIVTRIDAALARVVALHGPETLHECRALFRKRVPLHLRSYVAAALLFDGAAGPMTSTAAGLGKGARRPGGQDPVGIEDRQRGPKKDQKQASRQEPKRGPAGGQGRSAKRDEQAEPASPPVRRENRFQGEGVSIFISAGRRQRLYARVMLDMLNGLPGVAEESIGELRVMDNYSFVTIDPTVEERVIAGLNGKEFRGRPLSVNRAKKRDEPQAAEPPAEQ